MKNEFFELVGGLFGLKNESRFFDYDRKRFARHSGLTNPSARQSLLSSITIDYHVLEKGLTMPNRRLGFGKDRVRHLISLLNRCSREFGITDDVAVHAVGVLRAYREIHDVNFVKNDHDKDYWTSIDGFLDRYPSIPAVCQLHFTRERFFADRNADFRRLAFARHSVRNYAARELPVERLRRAVELASTAPSACNRQPCRVHCVTDANTIADVLKLQGGCRGFAALTNKLLILTSDLECAQKGRERNDVYTNGGIFLMNLCYALYHEEVAHCILNWSRTPKEDLKLRKLVAMKPSESVVAVLSCGEAPDEFDVAVSPHKSVDETFVLHDRKA